MQQQQNRMPRLHYCCSLHSSIVGSWGRSGLNMKRTHSCFSFLFCFLFQAATSAKAKVGEILLGVSLYDVHIIWDCFDPLFSHQIYVACQQTWSISHPPSASHKWKPTCGENGETRKRICWGQQKKSTFLCHLQRFPKISWYEYIR